MSVKPLSTDDSADDDVVDVVVSVFDVDDVDDVDDVVDVVDVDDIHLADVKLHRFILVSCHQAFAQQEKNGLLRQLKQK